MQPSICIGKLQVVLIYYYKLCFNILQVVFLTPLYDGNRIKTNITHTLGDRMVNVVEHLCMGYYDTISKKKGQAHVNYRNVLNYIMCRMVTKKLRHVSGDKSLVNPYQKPQRLINRLIELFSNPDEWVLDLFSGIGISYKTCHINLDYSISLLFCLLIHVEFYWVSRYYYNMCLEDVQELCSIGERP